MDYYDRRKRQLRVMAVMMFTIGGLMFVVAGALVASLFRVDW